MVSADEGSTVCILLDLMPDSQQKRQLLVVRPSYRVIDLLDDIKRQYQYDAFDVRLQTTKEADAIILNHYKGKTLIEAGIKFEPNYRNTLVIERQKKKHKTNAMESTTTTNGSTMNANSTTNGDHNNGTTDHVLVDDGNSKKNLIESEINSDDDLALGASASPTEISNSAIPIPPVPPALPFYESGESSFSLKCRQVYDKKLVKAQGSSLGKV